MASIRVVLAAGVLSLNDIAALVDIEGDESAVRNFFDAPKSSVDFTWYTNVAQP
jgi:hypothetical protein